MMNIVFLLFSFLVIISHAKGKTVRYVTDIPRTMFRAYDEISTKDPKSYAEKCTKFGYNPIFFIHGGSSRVTRFTFGETASKVTGYSFYQKHYSCKKINPKNIPRVADVKIPPSVQKDHEARLRQKPKLLSSVILVCQKKNEAVLAVTWSTGYVAGATYYSLAGKVLGNSSASDTGENSSTFNIKDFVCDLTE